MGLVVTVTVLPLVCAPANAASSTSERRLIFFMGIQFQTDQSKFMKEPSIERLRALSFGRVLSYRLLFPSWLS